MWSAVRSAQRMVVLMLFFLLGCFQIGTSFAQSDAAAEANAGTLGIISGSVTGTYARFAQDLADALDEPKQLRVLAILGKGSVQNIKDLRYLKNIDVAIVQSDVLKFFQTSKEIPDIRDKVHYIAKLYNEEVHVLARSGITTLKDLAGHSVNFGPKGSGTAMTSKIIFDAEDLQVSPIYLSNSEGLAALKAGTVDAAIFVAGKPASFFREIQADSGLHFLTVDYSKALEDAYLDAVLTSKDYPNLIKEGDKVETVAVGAVMAAYNWKKGSSRYERTAAFARRMFEGLPVLQSDAYHPKWKEVDIKGNVPGWQRFAAAEEWIASKNKRVGAR